MQDLFIYIFEELLNTGLITKAEFNALMIKTAEDKQHGRNLQSSNI